MFIEPKGEHLLEKDLWKGELLMQLEEKGILLKDTREGTTFEIM